MNYLAGRFMLVFLMLSLWTSGMVGHLETFPFPVAQKKLDADKYNNEILMLEYSLLNAMNTRDKRTLNGLLADNFIGTSFISEGEFVERAQYVESIVQIPYGTATFSFVGAVKITSYSEDAVIASFHVRVENLASRRPGLLKNLSGEYLVTDTWFKRNGNWQIAARHCSSKLKAGLHLI